MSTYQFFFPQLISLQVLSGAFKLNVPKYVLEKIDFLLLFLGFKNIYINGICRDV